MNRRFVHYLLFAFVFLNPLFFTTGGATDTYVWIGGFSNNWEDKENWRNMDTQTDGVLPVEDSDIMIDGNVSVTLSSAITTESVQLSGGATLTVAAGGSITTTEGGLSGSNSIRLDDVSPYPTSSNPNALYLPYLTGSGASTLIVNGTLNLDNDNANGSGLYISGGSSVTVGNSGSMNISNDGNSDEAIRVKSGGSLTNNGTITITNPGSAGISSSSGGGQYLIINNGTLTISGGDVGFDLGSTWIENSGTVAVSGTSGKILDGDGRFFNKNNGVFGGNGTVEADGFFAETGSTIAPGTSPGILTFDRDLDLPSGAIIELEVNGSTTAGVDYDQLELTGSADLDLSGVTLKLKFDAGYTPNGAINLIVNNGTGSISGDFNSVEIDPPGFLASYTVTANSTNVELSGTALPVELTSFTAKPTNKTVQLQWTTATETNNDYFSIEHSTDGRYFQEIGKVTGAGTTQAPQDYAFIHSSPATGLNYYRLNQHDFDGAQEYSPVQTVEMDGKNTWTAWPILAHDRINLDWAEAPPTNTIIEAYNLTGQKVYSQPVPTGASQVQIPVQQWASGWYSVVVQQNGAVSSQRVIKE